jgi:hypothetical protein
MSNRFINQARTDSHPAVVEAASMTAPECGRAGLWAYLAEVRVIATGGFRTESRVVRGLFCARNHHDARARATALAAEKARELGHVVDISLTRLW